MSIPMIGFGRSRVPSYFARAPRTPQSAVNPPFQANVPPRPAPSTPAVPYGELKGEEDENSPGGNPYANMTPATPAGSPLPATTAANRAANFQNSLNNQRAGEARSAQVFAQGSPLPTDSAGNYNGSYASPQQAQAAKDAYVDRQATASNLNSGNYFINRQLKSEANERENTSNAANAGYVNALAGGVQANTNLMVPAQADALMAQGQATRGANSRADKMMPYEADRMGAETQGIDAKTAAVQAGIPFIAKQNQQELDLGAQKLQGGAMDQDLRRAYGGAIIQSGLDKSAAETEVLRRPPPIAASAAVDPVKAAADREKAANEIGERNYGNQTLWQRSLPSWLAGESKQHFVDEARKMIPATPATPAPGGSGGVTPDLARQFLQQAGGDKNKAREMARRAGYTF